MKTVLLILGVLFFVYGLHWIGQGTGWLPWPANTVMDDNRAFVWYGAGLSIAAAALVWYAARRKV
jgi:hypothetical protein